MEIEEIRDGKLTLEFGDSPAYVKLVSTGATLHYECRHQPDKHEEGEECPKEGCILLGYFGTDLWEPHGQLVDREKLGRVLVQGDGRGSKGIDFGQTYYFNFFIRPNEDKLTAYRALTFSFKNPSEKEFRDEERRRNAKPRPEPLSTEERLDKLLGAGDELEKLIAKRKREIEENYADDPDGRAMELARLANAKEQLRKEL